MYSVNGCGLYIYTRSCMMNGEWEKEEDVEQRRNKGIIVCKEEESIKSGRFLRKTERYKWPLQCPSPCSILAENEKNLPHTGPSAGLQTIQCVSNYNSSSIWYVALEGVLREGKQKKVSCSKTATQWDADLSCVLIIDEGQRGETALRRCSCLQKDDNRLQIAANFSSVSAGLSIFRRHLCLSLWMNQMAFPHANHLSLFIVALCSNLSAMTLEPCIGCVETVIVISHTVSWSYSHGFLNTHR